MGALRVGRAPVGSAVVGGLHECPPADSKGAGVWGGGWPPARRGPTGVAPASGPAGSFSGVGNGGKGVKPWYRGTMDDPNAAGPQFISAADRKERILDALGDPASREILLMLNDAPHSAQEILLANQIPQSTLYRKLHDLQELGLLGIQRTAITAEGKRVDLYRSLLEELRVDLSQGVLRIHVRFRDLSAERLKDMWHKVQKEARP